MGTEGDRPTERFTVSLVQFDPEQYLEIKLAGELDANVVAVLATYAVIHPVTQLPVTMDVLVGSVAKFVLDVGALTFIDSAGIRSFLFLVKERQTAGLSKVVLKNVVQSKAVDRVLRILDASKVFQFE